MFDPAFDLSVDFCGKRMVNPFMLSSSPVSNSAEMIHRAFEAGWGGVAYKTISSPTELVVHPSPRMCTYDYQGRKLIGLQNVEQTSDRPIADNLADLAALKRAWPDRLVIGSIMGFSTEEWRELALRVADTGVDFLELNFSCPHMTVEGSGAKVGQTLHLVEKFTATVVEAVSTPVIAKLTPNITDICEPALYAKRGGAVALSTVNTVAALTGVDLGSFVPNPDVFGKGSISGYSGPAIKPIALRCIAELAQDEKLGLPLSGMGGIETWVDALEFILLGATSIQVTTGIIRYGYRLVEDLIEGLGLYLEERGISSVGALVGKALPALTTPNRFDLSRQGYADFDLSRCVGCGQCHLVCHDAGGQCLAWDSANRRPVQDTPRCLSCMVCSFVCPVSTPPLITYRERTI